MITIRRGPYISLPPDKAFTSRLPDSRDLHGLLERLPREAGERLRVAIPFFQTRALDYWLETWIRDDPRIKIELLHRQVFRRPEEEREFVDIVRRWRERGDVEFKTLPSRDPQTGRFPADAPTFHSKLIDPGTEDIILLSANLTHPARHRNVEVGYVFGPEEGHDFRTLIDVLFEEATVDPLGRT